MNIIKYNMYHKRLQGLDEIVYNVPAEPHTPRVQANIY